MIVWVVYYYVEMDNPVLLKGFYTEKAAEDYINSMPKYSENPDYDFEDNSDYFQEELYYESVIMEDN